MNYQETLQFLFSQLPMYQRQGKSAFKKDLTNILKLTEALGNPHKKFPSIHIAGTNGKGSTAHLIAAYLQTKGLRVGLYTSPHYKDFRERIKINGKYISKQAVIGFVKSHGDLFKQIQPSFFEITVALAFNYFAREKIDIAVIETGLGGRLDSTNIVSPLLSIITNISFDHQQFLGDTIEKIAGEKAGIIKEKIPVVIGERGEESDPVFDKKAESQNSPISFAEDKWKIENDNQSNYKIYFEDKVFYSSLLVDLHGEYQIKNLCTALEAIRVFETIQGNDFEKENDLFSKAAENIKALTNLKGRWEILGDNPKIIADSAHNEAGLKIAMNNIANLHYDNLHIVLGLVKDKDLDKIIEFFPKSATYYFAKPDIPRGLDVDILNMKAKELGRFGTSFSSVNKALDKAKNNAGPSDLIYIGGSTFVVAEVL